MLALKLQLLTVNLTLVVIFALITILLIPFCATAQTSEVKQENLLTIENWKHIEFSNNLKWSEYEEITSDKLNPNVSPKQETMFKLSSDNSASALLLNSKLKIDEQSILSWSWQVQNALPKLDASSKIGDDYAIRIYLMDSVESPAMSLFDRLKLFATSTFGDEKPGPTLAYVWTEHPFPQRCLPSPYTNLVKIIGITRPSGAWSIENVSPYADFQECFSVKPQGPMRLAIMADSDNSHASTLGYLAGLKLSELP